MSLPSRVQVSASDPNLGEIWALPQGPDPYPGSYVLIVGTAGDNQGSVEAVPLIHLPTNDDEDAISANGQPPPVGLFRCPANPTSDKIIVLVASLSHRADVIEEERDMWNKFYKIYPQKSQLWAVYGDYDEVEQKPEFKLVEIAEGYSEEEGVTVLAMENVEGKTGVYKRETFEGFNMLRSFSKTEMTIFSHQVPATRKDEWSSSSEMQWEVP